MRFPPLLALGATALAADLFVADYSGNITTLSLTETNGTYALNKTAVNDGCGPNPAWLTIDSARGQLFCTNEGLNTVNGSLASFSINADGSLERIVNLTTANGPVSAAVYGNPSVSERGLVLAHYAGSAVTTYKLSSDGNVTLNEEFFFELSGPGADAERQDAPHPHEAFVDPTGQYILVPDLGADLVRVFSWDVENLKLKELDPLKTEPGTGPRHVAFWNPYNLPGGTTYMYLVGELTATVTGYAVEYSQDGSGLSFQDIGYLHTTGLFNIPQRNAPAEIQVSPDNRFLIISNRNDTSFTLPNAIGKSDSISTFKFAQSGNLTAVHQLWPAGGSYPRHFETNAAGTLVAVGLQNSQAVAILKRDVATGLIGEPIARFAIDGNVTAVVWNEHSRSGVAGLAGY
ncbi:Putative nitrous oxide reductase, WD40/YVTN repeat-like-containing domain superfamily [Septoria linicola]|uniref:Nitrous oxide reductase, WD40/YVTN repeat-like-containing domain superfamily n=1 Tax=Septoria linicola TaxID=215465 RepID=A0A9Q9AP36_9PEZI|nr:putative nitrous oxide reductase, WD40/YVTN repeat-like-containing domain superfamily [Septoria linicola]USW50543.1 Putative nitrous oxide reductase, WD40/YVTN repeat-like-containing domain superfamily [Septoria linicola]